MGMIREVCTRHLKLAQPPEDATFAKLREMRGEAWVRVSVGSHSAFVEQEVLSAARKERLYAENCQMRALEPSSSVKGSLNHKKRRRSDFGTIRVRYAEYFDRGE